MNKLLRSNFSRLKSSAAFRLGVLVMIAYAIIACLFQYMNSINGIVVTLDSVFALPYIMTGIMLAVFCSLFIGTEYSDGTIRNKLIVGSSRKSIYLANFVVSAVAGIIMDFVFWAVVCALGIPLLGGFTAGIGDVLLVLLAGVLMTVSFAAVFTLIAMLNQNKAVSAIICCIGILVATFAASYLYSALSEPEKINSYMVDGSGDFSVTVNGNEAEAELVPNPRYLSGTKRKIYQFLMDFPPSGQMVQVMDMNTPNLKLMPIYSAIIIFLANILGAAFFRRKDLK